MKVVVQRVKEARVVVEAKTVGQIEKGLLLLAGIGREDTEQDLAFIANKVVNLRIFEDEQGKMNRSLLEIGGGLLVISQFTLYADCRKGRRPSFINAAAPEQAGKLFDLFVGKLSQYPVQVETGVFQAMMEVRLCNYGPVTIIMDSKEMLG